MPPTAGAEIDVDLTWKAIAAPITRGSGTTVPADAPDAYLGETSDARCFGKAAGRETGFSMTSGSLSEEGYGAFMGHTRNGVFLA